MSEKNKFLKYILLLAQIFLLMVLALFFSQRTISGLSYFVFGDVFSVVDLERFVYIDWVGFLIIVLLVVFYFFSFRRRERRKS